MEINNLGINNKKEKSLNNTLVNEKTQKSFLESTLGKTINTAIDIGIRSLLPNFVEDQVINIKDNLLNYGLKEGINKTINDAIDLGKSAIGIFTGNFENINQMKSAVETGGLIDGISSLLDLTINKTKQAGLLNKTVANTLKQGKDILLNNVQSNIEKTFADQFESIEKLENHVENWKKNYENKNFSEMEKDYKKLQKELINLAPLEKTIEEAKSIENLHILIKNNGQNFNLSKEEIELAQKLTS